MSDNEKLQKALDEADTPTIRWKIVGLVGLALAVMWLISGMLEPSIGIWGFVVSGVITVVVAGFGLYLWRMLRKSAGIVDVLKTAKTAEDRKAALAALEAKDPKGKDALNAIAKAQLLAQDRKISEAIETLEAVDIDKVSFMVQDQVRVNLAMFYLWYANRAKDARKLVDELRIDRAGQSHEKAFMAAIKAEAYSRTGKTKEAENLLQTYDVNDPAYQSARPALLRAEIYQSFKMNRKAKTKKMMELLGEEDVNALASFMQKGDPRLQKIAREVAQSAMGLRTQYQRPTR